jgi:hypothetical protein
VEVSGYRSEARGPPGGVAEVSASGGGTEVASEEKKAASYRSLSIFFRTTVYCAFFHRLKVKFIFPRDLQFLSYPDYFQYRRELHLVLCYDVLSCANSPYMLTVVMHIFTQRHCIVVKY